LPSFFHSQKQSKGKRQRRRLKASRKAGFVSIPSALALMFENPTLMSFAQKGHEPPAHDFEAALPGLGIVADHGEILARRGIPIGWNVGGRPLRPDREDEFDLADIGGETGAATHKR
jgi:hypothetical protein